MHFGRNVVGTTVDFSGVLDLRKGCTPYFSTTVNVVA